MLHLRSQYFNAEILPNDKDPSRTLEPFLDIIDIISFPAYLDNIEEKTGKTPQQFIDEAKAKGFDNNTKAGEVLAWLKEEWVMSARQELIDAQKRNYPSIFDDGAEIWADFLLDGKRDDTSVSLFKRL